MAPVPLHSPEPDLFAPGMIPPECESILEKSQEWGFRPGEKWKPASEEQAFAVAQFLSSFTIIPEKTSVFLKNWQSSSPPNTPGEAAQTLELMSRAQSCDAFLPQTFYEGLFSYRWKQKQELGRSLHSFLVNQQSRTSFLMPRAVSLFLFTKGVQRGFLKTQKGSALQLIELQKKLETKRADIQAQLSSEITAEAPPSTLQLERAMRKEAELAEWLREEMSRYLPLPK
jgi:hypothetical protein